MKAAKWILYFSCFIFATFSIQDAFTYEIGAACSEGSSPLCLNIRGTGRSVTLLQEADSYQDLTRAYASFKGNAAYHASSLIRHIQQHSANSENPEAEQQRLQAVINCVYQQVGGVSLRCLNGLENIPENIQRDARGIIQAKTLLIQTAIFLRQDYPDRPFTRRITDTSHPADNVNHYIPALQEVNDHMTREMRRTVESGKTLGERIAERRASDAEIGSTVSGSDPDAEAQTEEPGESGSGENEENTDRSVAGGTGFETNPDGVGGNGGEGDSPEGQPGGSANGHENGNNLFGSEHGYAPVPDWLQNIFHQVERNLPDTITEREDALDDLHAQGYGPLPEENPIGDCPNVRNRNRRCNFEASSMAQDVREFSDEVMRTSRRRLLDYAAEFSMKATLTGHLQNLIELDGFSEQDIANEISNLKETCRDNGQLFSIVDGIGTGALNAIRTSTASLNEVRNNRQLQMIADAERAHELTVQIARLRRAFPEIPGGLQSIWPGWLPGITIARFIDLYYVSAAGMGELTTKPCGLENMIQDMMDRGASENPSPATDAGDDLVLEYFENQERRERRLATAPGVNQAEGRYRMQRAQDIARVRAAYNPSRRTERCNAKTRIIQALGNELGEIFKRSPMIAMTMENDEGENIPIFESVATAANGIPNDGRHRDERRNRQHAVLRGYLTHNSTMRDRALNPTREFLNGLCEHPHDTAETIFNQNEAFRGFLSCGGIASLPIEIGQDVGRDRQGRLLPRQCREIRELAGAACLVRQDVLDRGAITNLLMATFETGMDAVAIITLPAGISGGLSRAASQGFTRTLVSMANPASWARPLAGAAVGSIFAVPAYFHASGEARDTHACFMAGHCSAQEFQMAQQTLQDAQDNIVRDMVVGAMFDRALAGHAPRLRGPSGEGGGHTTTPDSGPSTHVDSGPATHVEGNGHTTTPDTAPARAAESGPHESSPLRRADGEPSGPIPETNPHRLDGTQTAIDDVPRGQERGRGGDTNPANPNAIAQAEGQGRRAPNAEADAQAHPDDLTPGEFDRLREENPNMSIEDYRVLARRLVDTDIRRFNQALFNGEPPPRPQPRGRIASILGSLRERAQRLGDAVRRRRLHPEVSAVLDDQNIPRPVRRRVRSLVHEGKLTRAIWELERSGHQGASNRLRAHVESQMAQTGRVRRIIPLGDQATRTNYNGAYIVEFEDGTRAIFKPYGSRDLGVNQNRNEILAYRLDRLLGLNRVPPTVEANIQGLRGSLQLFVEGGETARDFMSNGGHLQIDPDLIVFDQLIANQDRHHRNFLILEDGTQVAIDNGFSNELHLRGPPVGGQVSPLMPNPSPSMLARLNDPMFGPQVQALFMDVFGSADGMRRADLFMGRLRQVKNLVDQRASQGIDPAPFSEHATRNFLDENGLAANRVRNPSSSDISSPQASSNRPETGPLRRAGSPSGEASPSSPGTSPERPDRIPRTSPDEPSSPGTSPDRPDNLPRSESAPSSESSATDPDIRLRIEREPEVAFLPTDPAVARASSPEIGPIGPRGGRSFEFGPTDPAAARGQVPQVAPDPVRPFGGNVPVERPSGGGVRLAAERVPLEMAAPPADVQSGLGFEVPEGMTLELPEVSFELAPDQFGRARSFLSEQLGVPQERIPLNRATMEGSGGAKQVFPHPADPSLVVKVINIGELPSPVRGRPMTNQMRETLATMLLQRELALNQFLTELKRRIEASGGTAPFEVAELYPGMDAQTRAEYIRRGILIQRRAPPESLRTVSPLQYPREALNGINAIRARYDRAIHNVFAERYGVRLYQDGQPAGIDLGSNLDNLHYDPEGSSGRPVFIDY